MNEAGAPTASVVWKLYQVLGGVCGGKSVGQPRSEWSQPIRVPCQPLLTGSCSVLGSRLAAGCTTVGRTTHAGPAHQRSAGLSDEQARSGNPALIFGGSFVLALVASATFALFLGPNVDAVTGMLYGLCAGLCWVGASFGINYLFERKNLPLFIINGGYHTLQFTLIGLILGAWH